MLKLIKLLPTSAVLGFVLMCLWPMMQKASPTLASPNTARAVAIAANLLSPQVGKRSMRDPFRDLVSITAQSSNAETSQALNEAGHVDNSATAAELTEGMVLNATLCKGRKPLAVIDGVIYHAGDPIKDADKEPTSLVLAEIHHDRIVLRSSENPKDQSILKYADTVTRVDLEAQPSSEDPSQQSPDIAQALSAGTGADQLQLLQSLLGPGAAGLAGPLGGVLNQPGAARDATERKKGPVSSTSTRTRTPTGRASGSNPSERGPSRPALNRAALKSGSGRGVPMVGDSRAYGGGGEVSKPASGLGNQTGGLSRSNGKSIVPADGDPRVGGG